MKIERDIPANMNQITKGALIGRYSYDDAVWMVAVSLNVADFSWYLVDMETGDMEEYTSRQALADEFNSNPDMYIMNARLVEL